MSINYQYNNNYYYSYYYCYEYTIFLSNLCFLSGFSYFLHLNHYYSTAFVYPVSYHIFIAMYIYMASQLIHLCLLRCSFFSTLLSRWNLCVGYLSLPLSPLSFAFYIVSPCWFCGTPTPYLITVVIFPVKSPCCSLASLSTSLQLLLSASFPPYICCDVLSTTHKQVCGRFVIYKEQGGRKRSMIARERNAYSRTHVRRISNLESQFSWLTYFSDIISLFVSIDSTKIGAPNRKSTRSLVFVVSVLISGGAEKGRKSRGKGN